MRWLELPLVLLAALAAIGCGGGTTGSSSDRRTAASPPGRAEASDDQVLSETLEGCLDGAERGDPEQAAVRRGLCHCVVARAREDRGFFERLRARDEAALAAQARVCLQPSMAIPFSVYAMCVQATNMTHEDCAQFALCVQQRLRAARTAEEFDAWFPAQAPEAQRQMAADASGACAQHLPSGSGATPP